MPLAHLAHFYSLIYAAPVLLLLGWMGITTLRERRARRRAARDAAATSTRRGGFMDH